MRAQRLGRRDAGFSLIEVVVAAGLLATVLVALADVASLATRGNLDSRRTTFATVLAQQKLEELRALTWAFDAHGLPVSDTTADTAASPEQPNGGTGLTVSPPTALSENIDGYVDYLDQFGNRLGGGANPPRDAVYVRRWSIQPVPSNQDDARVLQVLVTRNVGRAPAAAGQVVRLPGDALLVTIKTRKRR